MTPERYEQIERLYHAVLELQPDQRAAFLDQSCAGDEGMRSEVESLVRAHDQAPDFLRHRALEVVAREGEDRIGRYEILNRLGSGGMGEVYLARDEQLRRKVAIKLLLPEFTADPDHVSRFKREAIAASALNHPGIVTIYEIGQSDDSYYIAMEYIEGKTLRHYIAADAMEVRAALEVAQQIAAALAAAHEAGIVHRDIKPENVMIRPDRLVKVLDFGLAKLIEGRASSTDTTASTGPTISSDSGGSWVTPAYMSPERARGLDVDARTDIFSLGVVLYELVAGHRPFTGTTRDDVRAAILEREPRPLAQRAPGVPARLERIVKKALAKDRVQRYPSVKALLLDLQMLKQELERRARLWTSLRRLGWACALMLGLITLGDVPPLSKRPTPSARGWPSGIRIKEIVNEKIGSGGGISRPAPSPDGKLIAYSLNSGGESSIWVKQLAGGASRLISESRWGDRNPIWSPDGQHLAFISGRGGTRGVWKIPYMGGMPELLQECDLSTGFLTHWSKDGRTIHYEIRPNLYALDIASGQITRVTNFDQQSSHASEFSISHAGENIAYADSTSGTSHIRVASLAGGEPSVVTRGDDSARSPSWFPDGKRIAFRSNRTGSYQIYLGWLDLRKPAQVTSGDNDYDFLVVSPDGSRIISTSMRENANIFSCDIHTGAEVIQTQAWGLQLFPDVSPEGDWIAFQSSKASARTDEAIMIKSITAGSPPTQLLSAGFDAKWSPDGNMLAFLRYAAGKSEIRKVSASGTNEKLVTSGILFGAITDVPYNRAQTNYSWSPDGTRIAYCSERSGQRNLWIVAKDGSSDVRITNNADQNLLVASPLWSPDGNRIAYVSEMVAHSPSEMRVRSLLVWEQGTTATLFRYDRPLRLIGWSAPGNEMYVALAEQKGSVLPQEIRLVRISVANKKPKTIARVSATYLHNIRLSPDGQSIAFVSRQDGKDNVTVISTSGGPIKKISQNNDPTVYYSGLAWSPDGNKLYYSKQTSWALVSTIENFE